jgi:hypothetical protein
MLYELMGSIHARVVQAFEGERGQGTVEYVGLILLIGVVLAGVVKASGGFSDKTIATSIIKKLKGAIEGVGGK